MIGSEFRNAVVSPQQSLLPFAFCLASHSSPYFARASVITANPPTKIHTTNRNNSPKVKYAITASVAYALNALHSRLFFSAASAREI
jgi:hypothetical protein